MNTVRDLLDRVECQLVLALPRVLNIPDSLTHILTALPQGVTHVGVYVPQMAGVAPAGSEDTGPAGEIA
jgi:chromosome partition protein MukB